MIPLFKDEALQKEFEENGFVIVDALEEEQINTLKEFYKSTGLFDEKGYGFHVSMDNTDKKLVNSIIDKIYDVALPSVLPHFVNAKPYIASYVVKDPNPQGVVPVHQDWTFVEAEESHNSLTVWIPLVDVNMENGALGAIKGSHKFFDHVRPSPSPQVRTLLQEHLFTIFPYMNILEIKAGQAIVFDNRTFHASPPNVTEETRLAVGIGITQAESQLCHYSLNPNNDKELLKFKVDETFFREYDNSRLSRMYDNKEVIQDFEHVDTVAYEISEMSAADMVKMIQDAGNEINVPLITQLSTLFNYNLDGSQKKEEPVIEETVPVVETPAVQEKKLPFWKVYTPLNIVKEILFRMGILK
ncbi:MAG: hypothetical protein ACI94Y_003469 [Maribacter sp.]|jgi:ectoine hydroxylase-related dioxygenase (phytanoyl-CoA dioxygenase family)